MVSKVFLIGVGLGNPDTLTFAARTGIEQSDLLIGAARLLEPYEGDNREKLALIKADDIAEALTSSDAKVASVLFSGDIGFYSGASVLANRLEGFDIEAIPGISSLVYFCAKLLVPWHDAHLVSAHGRDCDPVYEMKAHGKTFFLTGGKRHAEDVCAELARGGLGGVHVHVGERLSYDDERITSGTAAELAKAAFDSLAVMLVENPAAPRREVGKLEEASANAAGNADAMLQAITCGAAPDATARVAAPRLLIAAPASGSGKTTFSCGLMKALINRELCVQACKCGPDYIDPMFHREVIGAASHNLDLFFMSAAQVVETLARGASRSDITVLEGVMGYYDGIGMSDVASSWDVARVTNTPAILVVDAHGKARSLAAEVTGFLRLRDASNIAGVVINNCSAALYPRLKELVESECGIRAFGYVPTLADCSLESRHLGLVTAAEVANLQEKLDRIAATLEETVDISGLIELAGQVPVLDVVEQPLPDPVPSHPIIAVARDTAFCFYYTDALDMLERLGAQLVEFSPLEDQALPEGACGLYLGGGYPELHVEELSRNTALHAEIRAAIADGLPTIAECGGFMYLHEQLEDDQGVFWPMVGAVPGSAYRTPKLGRFGYIDMTAKHDNLLCGAGESLPAHEFHYWDSDNPGSAFSAQKPQSERGWECAHATDTLYAGFPHLCLHAVPAAAARFVRACAQYKAGW